MFSGLFSAVASFIMGLEVITLTSVLPGKVTLGCTTFQNSEIELEWFAHHLITVSTCLKWTFLNFFLSWLFKNAVFRLYSIDYRMNNECGAAGGMGIVIEN
jgi:hypothetical protein